MALDVDDVGTMSQLEIPPNIIGESTGIAMAQLLEAGSCGAGIGELPPAASELLRERLQLESEFELLQSARNGRDVCWLDEDNPEPLVTVRIATFNKCEQLMDISLPSALNQTYDNIEVVVVGDCTDQTTVDAMRKVKDRRVRFYNLPRPSQYPANPIDRWRVGGSNPMNLGNDLAAGAWIAPCDDDDQLTNDHVESLLRHAIASRAELVYSKSLTETPTGWQVLGAEPPASGNFTHGSVLLSAALRFIDMSTTCYKLGEPQDANLWRRMRDLGVRMSFCDQVTYKYFKSTVFSAAAELAEVAQ